MRLPAAPHNHASRRSVDEDAGDRDGKSSSHESPPRRRLFGMRISTPIPSSANLARFSRSIDLRLESQVHLNQDLFVSSEEGLES